MKKVAQNLPAILIGVFIGALAMYLFTHAIISQEFSGLESAGNATYTQLRNEMMDDFVLLPLMTILPFGILAGVGMAVAGWKMNRTGKKSGGNKVS